MDDQQSNKPQFSVILMNILYLKSDYLGEGQNKQG